MLDEREVSDRIDLIQHETDLPAEARNALHACRAAHPLGAGQTRASLFRNAAFVLHGRVRGDHLVWLARTAETIHQHERAIQMRHDQTNAEAAYEALANGTALVAMRQIAGDNMTKQEIWRQTVAMCLMCDADDRERLLAFIEDGEIMLKRERQS